MKKTQRMSSIKNKIGRIELKFVFNTYKVVVRSTKAWQSTYAMHRKHIQGQNHKLSFKAILRIIFIHKTSKNKASNKQL